MNKKSKHPTYDDPSAFKQQFPRIVEVKDGSMTTVAALAAVTKIYTMGKCKIILHQADAQMGWFMSVQRTERYNLIPDAAIMSLVLPNLNNYINHEGSNFKNVFTMEQKGWAIDPRPMHCGQEMVIDTSTQDCHGAIVECKTCHYSFQIDFATWNEKHGNGFNRE